MTAFAHNNTEIQGSAEPPWMTPLDPHTREAVRNSVSQAPKLTDRQREHLRLLFRDTRATGAAPQHDSRASSMPQSLPRYNPTTTRDRNGREPGKGDHDNRAK